MQSGCNPKACHSNESYEEDLSYSFYYSVQGGLAFESVDEILKCDHSNEATEQFFHLVLFIMLYKVWDKC